MSVHNCKKLWTGGGKLFRPKHRCKRVNEYNPLSVYLTASLFDYRSERSSWSLMMVKHVALST